MARFQPGNKLSPGRPRGAVSLSRRRFAEEMRELWRTEALPALRAVLKGRNANARVRAAELVASYGYGKPENMVRLGLDKDSPEAVLLRIAGQPFPAIGEGEEGDSYE